MTFRTVASVFALVAAAACASTSKETISDKLTNLGLSRDRSDCISNELDDRLDDGELSQFARFLTKVDQADSTLEVINSLRQIEDPKIARAITGAAFSCAVT